MNKQFSLSIGDKPVKMALVTVSDGENIENYGCPTCKRSSAKLQAVCDVIQYGFECDKCTTIFYCHLCERHTAIQYTLFHEWSYDAPETEVTQRDAF